MEDAERFWHAQGLHGKISFLGATAHGAVLDLMCRSDVLLHPAVEESFGVVIAEAMAIGLPVIAGKQSGAVPWVVEDIGHLVDVSSPGAMAEALLAALTSAGDDRETLQRGRDRVHARFSPAVVADAYEAQYARAMAESTCLPH